MLHQPKVYGSTTVCFSAPFLATVVMDIDRHIQVDVGIRDRLLEQTRDESYPLCASAKDYYHKYVKNYKEENGHPQTVKICVSDAKKNSA